MRVALLSQRKRGDLEDRTGVEHYVYEGLRLHGVAVERVFASSLSGTYRLLYRATRQYVKRVVKKRFAVHYEPLFLRRQAQDIDQTLTENTFDCLLATSPTMLCQLCSEIPSVLWVDSTFAGAVDFIPCGKSISERHKTQYHKMEQQALDKVRFAVFRSEWAASTALDNYNVDAAKIRVVPTGANLEVRVGRTEADIAAMIDARPKDRLKMLFVAGEWYNKRGDLAVNVAGVLNDRGLDTTLDIVGPVPESTAANLPEFVTHHGAIDKSVPGGLERIKGLFAGSHVLIMPSYAECQGIQYCEASAFGVPSLGTNVGGVSSVVTDGVNGKLFDRDAPAEQYALYLESLFRDRDRYDRLCRSSFQEYVKRLNWETSVGHVLDLMRIAVTPDLDAVSDLVDTTSSAH